MQHPFVGLIVFYDSNGEFVWRCSGSLISPTKFLTAGHCTDSTLDGVAGAGAYTAKLPADNVYFAKARAGLEGSLHWLDTHLAEALRALPVPRDLSLFEVSLFCLIDHLTFRGTVAVEAYPSLVRFAREFAARPSAQRTVYRFDAPAAM